MRDFNKRISLILVILILFIGASIVPIISGQNVNSTIKKTIEKSTNYFLNDDFLNAYWKFDECSGNTLEDSSLHHYDGIIDGATWTSDSYSGCALSFDGVNDYIKLDNYAKNYLGFNKTDDFIFSFYFKTSSTNKGIIFSQCRGDSYGYNPGFQIALNPNGTIQVQVWRLNCGILMNSNGSYNDNVWHEAEIFYNGITTNPIVDIYVDGTFDSTYEKYVCSFYADQFKYADIGRNSHEHTDHYEGKLDEIKYIKYPGGNEQNPPIIDGPTYGEKNVEYDYTFTTDDPEEDQIWIQIDWGNGDITDWEGPYTSGEVVTNSNSWSKDGTYEVKARTKDRWHQSGWSDIYEVIIGNRPPDAPTINGPKSGEAGNILSYKFKSNDYEGDTVLYYVEWGDGTNDDWFGPYQSGQEVTATHSWDVDGVYKIRAKAKNINGNTGDWSEFYEIRVGNDPPSVPDINGPREGKTGVEYTYNFISTDPNGDVVKFEINWGDGDEEITEFYPSGEEVIASHTWTRKGDFKIKARALDPYDGNSNYKEITVTIPRAKTVNLNLFEWLFERFPNVYILINHLLGL